MRITLTVTAGPNKGRVFMFDGRDRFIVGRSKLAHFRLPPKDRYFSRIHFLIEVNPPHCRLMDMGSRNGTYVNGQEVTAVDLNHGDRIRAGRSMFKFALHSDELPDTVRPAANPLNTYTPPAAETAAAAPVTEPLTPLQSELLDAVPLELEDAIPLEPEDAIPLEPVAESPPEEEMPEYEVVDPDPPAVTAPELQLKAPSDCCRVCLGDNFVGGEPLSEDLFPRDLAPICPSCQEEISEQPQLIDDYVLVRKLGKGGMGVVLLALRKSDGKLIAVKMIKPAVTAEPRDLQRFLREASILRDLTHPNIVAFQEMGEVNGRPYIGMDFVRGTDASRLVKTNGPLPIARAVRLVCQLLEALEYAHAKDYVHRDIKPANLLVTQEEGREVVKVADFGLARIYQSSKLSGVTLQGDIGGTVAYMAPEQITNFRQAMPAADYYAAGATLYTLLTNRLIYDMPPRVELQMLKVLHDTPVSIRDRRPEIPDELATVIHRALSRKPGDRFESVAEMRRALEPFGDD